MIIYHSSMLLEHLSEIEEKIRKIELLADALGVEIDREKLLKILIGQRIKSH